MTTGFITCVFHTVYVGGGEWGGDMLIARTLGGRILSDRMLEK